MQRFSHFRGLEYRLFQYKKVSSFDIISGCNFAV